MKFLARHDTLIAIIGTAVLTIGYYLGIIAPGQNAAQMIKADIAAAHERIGNIPVLEAERSHLQKRLEKKRARLMQMEEALPGDSHVSSVLHQVASQARQSRLTIARLEPLPTVDFASYSAHPFHLSCRGTFADITAFLKGLESQPRLITFGNVGFTRGSDDPTADGAKRTIQANIDFSVYSRNSKTTKLAENTSSRPSSSSDN